MADLYDLDVLAWSEAQVSLLRAAAVRDRSNEPGPDWENVIEEIEGVGRSELAAVESLWTLALLHDLKAQAWPESRDGSHWRAEARLFRRQARRRFTPSMRQKIDVPALYADALAGLPETMDGVAAGPVAAECPLTLDQLLAAAG